MAHTPSFSKRINESLLLAKRLSADTKTLTADTTMMAVFPPIRGELDEQSAQLFVYYDFYQRIQQEGTPLPVMIVPRLLPNEHHLSPVSLVESYYRDYQAVLEQLNTLAITHHPYHLYHTDVIQGLKSINQTVVESRHVGLRSDVGYYDIDQGTLVPDHRLVAKSVMGTAYLIRFFLNSNKETITAQVNNPYDIFGCVALLIHPQDKRYKKARGRDVILPICNRSVPVIPYEGVNIEGLGTRLLIPAHNREDFKIAQELGLPLDVYIYDENGNFTIATKDFAGKPLRSFTENIVNFLSDISNLESTTTITKTEYRDQLTDKKLYPLLQKNLYMGLGYHSAEDPSFVSRQTEIGNVKTFTTYLEQEENFCISNQHTTHPGVGDFGGYFPQPLAVESQHLIQDIIVDFYRWGLLRFPAKGDDIIDILTLEYDHKPIWKTFFEIRTQQHTYPNAKEVFDLLSVLTTSIPDDQDIDRFLEALDLGAMFIHTKHGYIIQELEHYHYDYDYLTIAVWLSMTAGIQSYHCMFVDTMTAFYKYFSYMYNFTKKQSLPLYLYSLEPTKVFGTQWNLTKTMKSDIVRVMLLQGCHHQDHQSPEMLYSPQDLERFFSKLWNFARVVQKPAPYSTLSEIVAELTQLTDQMSHYDKYVIMLLHDVYDELVFLLQKHHTDQAVQLVITTVWDKIMDMLVYVLKLKPSPVSDKVAFYVLTVILHLLYPIAPTIVVGLFENLAIQRTTDFFGTPILLSVEKNTKFHFLMQFIHQWYKTIKTTSAIQGFVLQANKDFLDFVSVTIDDFTDFIGKEYTVTLLPEHSPWPEQITPHKIFSMQWGIIQESPKLEVTTVAIETQDSLVMLKKQLSYKQQLLQTMKNTLIRVRTSGQKDKESYFEDQIAQLEKEIVDIEYQISKLKYF